MGRIKTPAKKLFIKFYNLYGLGLVVKDVAKKVARDISANEQSLARVFYGYRYHKLADAIIAGKMTVDEIPARATNKWIKRKALEFFPEEGVSVDDEKSEPKTEYDKGFDHTEKSIETLSLTWIVSQIRQLYELEENNRNKVEMLRFLTTIADKYNEELKSDLAQIKNMSLRELVKMVGDLIKEMGENEILADTIKMLADQLQTPEDVVKKQITEED